MVTLYGFNSCDTVRKARAWLDGRGVDYTYFDYRARPLDEATVASWFARAGWEAVLNRGSTTFKQLPDAQKEGLDEGRALPLILERTSLIKRPVLDLDGRLFFGFKPALYEEAFATAG